MIVKEFKYGIFGMPKLCDITFQSGDTLNINYIDPNGVEHDLVITAQNLVVMVSHQQTEAAMILRPSAESGVQFLQPSK